MSAEHSDPVSDDELKTLIMSACSVSPHTEEDLGVIHKWAHDARVDAMLLDMVLRGEMDVFLDKGEISFKAQEVPR